MKIEKEPILNVGQEQDQDQLLNHDFASSKVKPLTTKEASEYLGISLSSLYKLTSGCKIPHYSPGGKILYFLQSDLDKYMLQNRRSSVYEIIAKGGKKVAW